MMEIKSQSGNPTEPQDLPAFSIGSNFFQSICENQSGPQSRYGSIVLESCARVVLNTPKNSIDPFMKGQRSKSEDQWVRERDQALAYRTHVTKSGEGLRLVFWRTPSNLVEFANVSVHNDLSLLEGVAAQLTCRSWNEA